MNMQGILTLMAERGASDLYLSANAQLLFKINGQLVPMTDHVLPPLMPRALLTEILTPLQMEELEQVGELNIGIGVPKVGGFRLSAFKQRNTLAAVIRCIPVRIPSIDTLQLPPVLAALALEKRGLILMVGATGQVSYGRIPAGSVVVSGNLPSSDGLYSLYCAVIVKRVDAQTRSKTSINELLRA